MKKLLIAIGLLGVITSCHHNEEEDPADKTSRKTILVYMAAENNLARFATDDLNEMKKGSLELSEDQNLIVYVDRAGSNTSPFLARVKNGELIDTVFTQEALAADPSTLESVLRQTREMYPAKSYGLVLWGHASGWIISNNDSISYNQSRSMKTQQRAYGGSTGNNSNSGSGKYWMNIVPMAKAIANGMSNNKLKFIFGDCCSFGCMEVAYELRNITEYVLGSPAEVPDMGAPFNLIVPKLFLESDNFYELVINDYYNYYVDVYNNQGNNYYNSQPGDLAGYSVPLVAIKCNELDNFAQATSTILGKITDKVNASGTLNLEHAMYYAIYNGYRYSYDICDVLRKNTTTEDFSLWEASLQKAVPYSIHSRKWMTNFSRLRIEMQDFDAKESDCASVSMFFPSTIYSNTRPNWNKAIQQFQWNNVIHWEKYGW